MDIEWSDGVISKRAQLKVLLWNNPNINHLKFTANLLTLLKRFTLVSFASHEYAKLVFGGLKSNPLLQVSWHHQ